jgi:isoquinoline 1-oxidoreductase beta subunit
MRVAGATMRQMLEQAASRIWNVSVNDCHAVKHTVVHTPSGRKLDYAALVKVAATLPLPSADHAALTFKPRSQWMYVEKPMPIVDLHDMVQGKAKYGIDTALPGMKYASIERCPVYGGKVKSFDAAEALKVPGVEKVIEITATPIPSGFMPLGGIAVIANNTWAAQQGRTKLKIDWDYGPNADYDTTKYRAELESVAQKPGRAARKAMSTRRLNRRPSASRPIISCRISRILRWRCRPAPPASPMASASPGRRPRTRKALSKSWPRRSASRRRT